MIVISRRQILKLANNMFCRLIRQIKCSTILPAIRHVHVYVSQRAENVRCWSDICSSAHRGAKDSLNLGTDPHQREEALSKLYKDGTLYHLSSYNRAVAI